MIDTDVFGSKAPQPPGVPLAIINPHFLRAWRSWLLRPGDRPRPEALDNSCLLCEHDKLNFNPSISSDLNDSAAIITLEEWRILEDMFVPFTVYLILSDLASRYSAGPLLRIYSTSKETGTQANDLSSDRDSCEECRRRRYCSQYVYAFVVLKPIYRKLTYDYAQVTLILLKSDDPIPTGDRSEQDHDMTNGNDHATDFVVGSSSSKANGQRQSRRIRENKDKGKRKKIEIGKDMTVKDIKVLVSFREDRQR